MDGLMLLRRARQAGLRVGADGDRLVVEGPRRLESMARTLLAEKPEVLRALAREGTEVGWRVQVMRPQVPAKGAIPLLVARPGGPWDQGRCCSCGDALEADEGCRSKTTELTGWKTAPPLFACLYEFRQKYPAQYPPRWRYA